MQIKIPFTQMSPEELFVVLAGGEGVMAQLSLQEIVDEYKKRHGEITDLVTMERKKSS